jgi:hypothetical protein
LTVAESTPVEYRPTLTQGRRSETASPFGNWGERYGIPKHEADQAREAQLVRLQAVRMLLWNQASADPIRAAEALIKLEAREARLLGLDMPTKVAVTDPDGDGIPAGDHPPGDGPTGPGQRGDGGRYSGTGTAASDDKRQ